MTTPKVATVRKKATPKVDEVEVAEVAENEVVKTTEEKPTVKPAPKAKVTVKKEPNVRVVTKVDYRTYIGDQWYNFRSGVQTSVPKEVKEILLKAGVLGTI